ncbi:hypothetical protein BaRGS_00020027 [Batillaria attramentaria]|uniref:Uncharacterized protein n=1 Tax=Batillaria attramentaria TaxID=370345 RepID=A0ABD0KNA7_9CAEN
MGFQQQASDDDADLSDGFVFKLVAKPALERGRPRCDVTGRVKLRVLPATRALSVVAVLQQPLHVNCLRQTARTEGRGLNWLWVEA